MIFHINGCVIDTDAYEVRRDGKVWPVEPQVFDLLVLLVENRGRVVFKEEIIDRIWHGRAVSEATLSSRIMSARRTIGDNGVSQEFIRTIRSRGFRFVGEVGQCAGDTAHPHNTPAAARNQVGTPTAALGMPEGPAVAVLPFNDAGVDAHCKFLGSAIVEEIAAQLSRFSELRVAGRTIVNDYRGSEADVGTVGRKLGVEYQLVGSLRQAGERVRVAAHLIDANGGKLLWAETYERCLTPADIFAIEDDIASKAVAAIASISAGVIARAALDRGRGKPPRELSAYEAVVRANEVMQSGFSAATHLTTRSSLEAAVMREPDYVAAWAVLAWVHTLEYTYGYNRRAGADPLERALAAARRAVELAPANPVARFAMARAAYVVRDLDLFYAEASSALALNPHDPLLLGNLGNWLAFSGRWDDGVALVRKAIALNPRGYPRWWHAALGKDRYRRHEFRLALAEFKNMNLPDWWWNQVELTYTYGQLGELENARSAARRLLELYPGFDLEVAVMEHRKYSFEQSYIDLAVEGLGKAGIPGPAARREADQDTRH